MTSDILLKKLGTKLKHDKDISPYFTLHMKVVASNYLEVESRDEWITAVKLAYESKTPIFILGGGSNIAVTSGKIHALVIRNRYIYSKKVRETNTYVEMLFSSGYPMSRVVKETIAAGLSGFEYHLGLPGTLGGAMYMNSKWTKPESYCGDTLIYANVMTREGKVHKENKSYFKFAYDYSILQETKEIFLEGVYRLKKENTEILKRRSEEALTYRKKTQPFGVSTCGCFFQNISVEDQKRLNLPTTSVGYLIDDTGLKGKRIGAFEVSTKHANFIINHGSGKPDDLEQLLDLIRESIRVKYGLELKEEVVIV